MRRCAKCVHQGRRVCFACMIQTAIFPIEHTIWRFIGPVVGITF